MWFECNLYTVDFLSKPSQFARERASESAHGHMFTSRRRDFNCAWGSIVPHSCRHSSPKFEEKKLLKHKIRKTKPEKSAKSIWMFRVLCVWCVAQCGALQALLLYSCTHTSFTQFSRHKNPASHSPLWKEKFSTSSMALYIDNLHTCLTMNKAFMNQLKE